LASTATTIHATRLRDQLRAEYRRGVDTDLVGAGVQQIANVLHRAHPSTDRERDEHLGSNRLDDVEDDAAIVGAGGDVQETQLVRALLVVATRDLHRVAGIPQAYEADALDHAPAGHIEAGDDALGEGHGP
jgi:hypothetical protein